MSTNAPVEAATGEEPRGLSGLPYEACEIRTERLLLRPLAMKDFADVDEYRRKREAVVRYLHWEVHNQEESVKRLKKHMAMTRLAKDGDGLVFAVELAGPDGPTGRVIGDVNIYLKSAKHAQLEIGWVFHPAVHGRGYAPEAVEALLKICFDTLGAHRVYAALSTKNEVSGRLCETIGMRREGVLVQNEIFKGEWSDTAIHAILADEFAARSAE